MKYIEISKLKNQVLNTEYNKWAIAMLEMIAKNEWWEETETEYFINFFKLWNEFN